MARLPISRLAAAFLLLLTGAELFACEMIAPQSCESFGLPETEPGGSADDNCICCCTHVLIAVPIPLLPQAERVFDVIAPVAPKPEHRSFSIYHPPRV